MQPYTERSVNAEAQPGTNDHSNVDQGPSTNVRMTIREAAAALGITVEAVRGRMHRGKYGREKAEDGRVFVVLAPDQLMNGRERSASPEANVPEDLAESTSNRSGNQSDENDQLVEELRDHLTFLRAELEARNEEIRRREEEHREEARRKDTIIVQLAQRIPELPSAASLERRDTSEAASEETGKGDDDVPPESQKPVERRSWLHRFFGFE